MNAIESRLKRLESVTYAQRGVACLLRGDDESDEACVGRLGYQGRPASSYIVINEADARL